MRRRATEHDVFPGLRVEIIPGERTSTDKGDTVRPTVLIHIFYEQRG
jgi:hypothetical protein